MSNHRLRYGLGALLMVLVAIVIAYELVGTRVTLLTGELPHPSDEVPGCYTSGDIGELVVDPVAGTAILEDNGDRYPVIWQVGYTGRQIGSMVEVLDSSGAVVARTGTRVNLEGGYTDAFSATRGFLSCGNLQTLP
jgi:hypothetical protein